VVGDRGLNPLSFAQRLRRLLQGALCGLETRRRKARDYTAFCSQTGQPLELVDLVLARFVVLAGQQRALSAFVFESLMTGSLGRVRGLLGSV
jgi:hypothetical protein